MVISCVALDVDTFAYQPFAARNGLVFSACSSYSASRLTCEHVYCPLI